MAEGAQINPKIKLATKARLMEFCKERGHAQGEVVEAALEAYFAPAEGDTQMLLFQKVNELGQGMKEVVALLGTVIQFLERQAKPLPPKIATAAEMYPDLQQTVPAPEEVESTEDAPPTPPRSSWRGIFRGRQAV